MTWSHLTTGQAQVLRACLMQLGIAPHRQYWKQAQTHDDDYTCQLFDPTPEERTALAALMPALEPHPVQRQPAFDQAARLSPEGYAATGGTACPACGTPRTVSGLLRREGTCVTEPRACLVCQERWNAIFELVGYEADTPTEEDRP